jgi:hypothetical protein
VRKKQIFLSSRQTRISLALIVATKKGYDDPVMAGSPTLNAFV